MVCSGGISRAGGSFFNVLCRRRLLSQETIRCSNIGVSRSSSSKKAGSTNYPNSPGVTTTVRFLTMATVISGNVLGQAQVSSPSKKLKFDDGMDVENDAGKENTGTREVLRFVKMTDKAHTPTKGSKYAAGFDLMSAYEYVVPARGSCLVKTDIQIQLPHGTYGRVAPRSGLALKHKIDVGAGVIDEDYRGNVGVILFNFSEQDFKVAAGDRIAQLICERIAYPALVEMESLDESERGAGGFGSTGTKST